MAQPRAATPAKEERGIVRPAPSWPFLLALLVPTVVVFGGVVGHEFLSYDDAQNIVNNPLVNHFSSANLLRFWREPLLKLYIPITYSFWGLLAQLSRWFPGGEGAVPNPQLFHLANLLVHLGTTAMVFRLASRMVGVGLPAAAAALLFALHPVQVEAVAWVTGMKDLLAGLFGVAALWGYVNFSQAAGRGYGFYGLATLCFLAALLAKPSSVVLPLLAAVVGFCWLARSWRQLLFELGPWLLLALPVIWLTRQAQTVVPEFVPNLGQRFLVAGDALSFYLYKLLLPVQMVADYGRTPQFVLSQGWSWFTGLLPGILSLVLFYCRGQRRLLGAFFFLAISLLPVLGFVSFAFQGASTVADRYLYLGILGPAMAIGGWLARHDSRARRLAILVILLLLGVRSGWLVPQWHDNLTFYRATVAANPRSWFAWNNLGLVYQGQGNADEALAAFRQAIAMRPEYAAAWNNLGVLAKELGRRGEARQAFAKAVAVDPAFAEAYSNQGNLNKEEGRLAEAGASYRQAIKAQPEFAEPYASLGILAKELNRKEEALAYYRQALARQPAFPEVYNNMGIIYEESGQSAAASAAYRQAIALKPDFGEACNNLGHLYLGMQRGGEAIVWFEKAIASSPGHPLPYYNLGLAYLQLGRREEARGWLQKAVAVDPTFRPAQEELAGLGGR